MKILELNDTLDIPRENLPQIDFKMIDQILEELSSLTTIKSGTIPTNDIKPVQDKINIEKVSNIISSKKYEDDRRLFVSKDGYLVDGHHYWAANKKMNSDKRLNVFLVNMNIVDLINWFNNSKYIEHKTINEGRK